MNRCSPPLVRLGVIRCDDFGDARPPNELTFTITEAGTYAGQCAELCGTAHAEMLALTQAESAIGDRRLSECDLYVTKEPCPMCAGAIVLCRVRRVIFGCADPKAGAAGGFWNLLQAPNLNHRSEITAGVLAEDCVMILKDFFRDARERNSNGIVHKKGLAGA